MKLEIGNFYVESIEFGENTELKGSKLIINKEEALAVVCEDEHIISADLRLVKPGDEVRLVPVKDALEPRCKVEGGKLYPGITNELTKAGMGKTHALKNCSILVIGEHMGGFQDGLIDMSGEGAKYSHFSRYNNICLVADTDETFERFEQQKKNKALRWAGMRLAEYIGNVTRELTAPETEVFELAPVNKREDDVKKLPSVVYVMQLQSQMEEDGYNALVYGWNANHMVPTFMHPNEVLDGAIVSGSFMPVSSKFSTYDHSNNPVIKNLYSEHGKTINFLGVIMSNLNVALEQKQRSALFVSNIASSLGADGAIVAEEGYGNPDADFIACIVELEKAGVKVVGITNECTGRDGMSQPLVALDPLADAIVSTGNVSELIELPPMKEVIGELDALQRDGLSGGWEGCVKEDGSIIMENNAMFCGDGTSGFSVKTMKEY